MNKKKILARAIGMTISTGLLMAPAVTSFQVVPMLSVAQAAENTSVERTFVVTGTVQTKAGSAKDWDPSDTVTRMKDMGDGFYEYSADLPAGAYFYKISVNGSWAENYGLGGNFDGANVQLTLEKPQRVTFYYNDKTHQIKDSTTYQKLTDEELPQLTGDFGDGGVMRDTSLAKFYETAVNLKKGSYRVQIAQKGSETLEETVNIAQDGKVSFYYDSEARHLVVDDGSIHADGILHDTWSSDYREPFEAVAAGSPAKLTLTTKHGEVGKVDLSLTKAKITSKGGDEYNLDYGEGTTKLYPMTLAGEKDGKDIWEVRLTPQESGVYGYKFILNGMKEYGDDSKPGHVGEVKLRNAKPFQLTVYEKDFHTPEWAKEAVVCQIFPDRFFNGDPSNDHAREFARGNTPIQHKSWEELPANHSKTPDKDGDPWECNDFFGGDLAGITKKLDYLKDLGYTAIYVNPIMNACSNHRYDAVDYGSLDPLLGTMEDFKTLAGEMQKRGMHLIMDGVFNHIGDDSIYFDRYGKYKWVGAYEFWAKVYDHMNAEGITEAEAKEAAKAELLAEGQVFSPYHWENWLEIKNEKTKDDMGEHYRYHDWQGYSSLVPFRDADFPGSEEGTISSDLGNYLLYDKDAVITKWFRDGLSCWRLDCAKEVPQGFWRNVRKEVKKMKTVDGEEPLLLGEIWQDGSQFLTGDSLDSVMNYKLSFALGDLFLNQGKAEDAEVELKNLQQNYPKEALYDLMNIVDSHDTVRAIYKFGGGKENVAQASMNDFDYKLGKARLKMAVAFLMGYPGMPTLFYGDEAGVYGSADPDCRRTFPWGKEDKELQSFYKKAIAVRNDNKALFAHGDVKTLFAKGDVYAFSRKHLSETAVVALNRGKAAKLSLKVDLPNGTVLKDALHDGYEAVVENGEVTLKLGENMARMLLAK